MSYVNGFGQISDLVGKTLSIFGKRIIDENRNLTNIKQGKFITLNVKKNAEFSGDINVNGNVTSQGYRTAILTPPTFINSEFYSVLPTDTTLFLKSPEYSPPIWSPKGTNIPSTTTSRFSGDMSPDGLTIVNTDSSNNIVKVFDWNGVSWVQRGDDFQNPIILNHTPGRGASLSGNNTLALGFRNTMTGECLVQVRDWNGSTWVQRGADIITSTSINSGEMLVMAKENPNILVIGGNLISTSLTFPTVYYWNGSSWTIRGVLPENRQLVSVSYDGNSIYTQTQVVYVWNGTSFDQRSGLPSDFYQSGSLSRNGDNIVVSKITNPTPIKMFRWNGISWEQRGSTVITNTSISIVKMSGDGNTVVISSKNGGPEFEIYNWSGTDWVLSYSVNLSNVSSPGASVLGVSDTGECVSIRTTDEIQVFSGEKISNPVDGNTIMGLTLPSTNIGQIINIQSEGNFQIDSTNTDIVHFPNIIPGNIILSNSQMFTTLHSDGINWFAMNTN